MPVTPFHFGPGILFKGASRRFSLSIFILSQILIDLESAWNLLREHAPVHATLHTYLGSLLVVGVCMLIGCPYYRLVQWAFRKIRKYLDQSYGLDLPLGWTAIFLSALIGVWSHVALDSIMHWDIRPFAPFSRANPSYEICSLIALHLACVWSGVLGGIIYYIRGRKLIGSLPVPHE